MACQGNGSSSVDKEVMDTLGVQIKDLLFRLRNKGVDFEWSNDQILAWYNTEGRKLETKAPFKKILVAIVYMLRRNDLTTITENERVIANIKELETQRSDELKKLRAQVEASVYDKQTWARQGNAMESKMKKLEKKFRLDKEYTSALEECCESAGFPVSAVKVAAINSKIGSEIYSDSDDDIAALSSSRQGHLDLREREFSLETANEENRPEKPKQRSPIMTRIKSGSVHRKPVNIAVLKTMKNADDEVTTISRPLTCEECTKHKEVVGMMPRKGPFQPYWDNLMLQASVYKLEIRDVWQVALLTIPDELKPKMPRELRSGEIVVKQEDEDENDVYERLRGTLLELRGPTHAEWSRILEIKQANKEPFEIYAERLWVTYKEHSGLEDAQRDQEVLLQLLKNNAGSHIQQALAHGADPPENTYRSLVDWASKIEARLKQNKARSIATTQWLAEGKGVGDPNPKPQIPPRCKYCKKINHTVQNCLRLKRVQNNQTMHSKNDSDILRRLGNLIAGKDNSENSLKQTEEKTTSQESPYNKLQTELAALLAKFSEPQ